MRIQFRIDGVTSRFAHRSLNFSNSWFVILVNRLRPSLTILYAFRFVIISVVFFCLRKLLVSGFLQFNGYFVWGHNNSKYRDWVTFEIFLKLARDLTPVQFESSFLHFTSSLNPQLLERWYDYSFMTRKTTNAPALTPQRRLKRGLLYANHNVIFLVVILPLSLIFWQSAVCLKPMRYIRDI